MSRLSLRWRLTLYYAGVLVLVSLIGGSGFLLALSSSLDRTLVSNLRDAAALAASQLGGDEAQFSKKETAILGRGLIGAVTISVYDERERLTERFGLSRVSAPLTPGIVSLEGTRVLTVRLSNGEWIQAAQSEKETSQTFNQVLRALLFGVPVLLLAGLAAGYLIVDRALRPMDRVSVLAARIAHSGQYRERVPLAPGDDELARLTRTVNAMLMTLEGAIERERAFALAAAHELRSPLTVLRGRASLTLETDLSPEEYRKAVRQMLKISAELTELVESLLTLARSDQPAPRRAVNLEATTLEAVRAQRLTQPVHFELNLRPAPTRGDPSGLRVVAANLISNAVLYGHSERRVGTIWVDTWSDQTHAMLEVCDDGEGIADHDLERLQQPFQRGHSLDGRSVQGRSDQGRDGSGMGLALVNAIVQQHGGQVLLSRADAGGLSARVILPK